MPLVSISDKRLGGIENSSLRYLSATHALEFSTSRIVSPSFSRRVRRLLPAGSMGMPPQKVQESYQRQKGLWRLICGKKLRAPVCYEIRTPGFLLCFRNEMIRNRNGLASGESIFDRCGFPVDVPIS